MERIKQKWVGLASDEASTETDILMQEGLGYENVVFPFGLVLCGTVVAFMILASECVRKCFKVLCGGGSSYRQ